MAERAGVENVRSFQDLIVWQKSIELVKETYRLVRKLPKEETYALSDQMRRASVSIPSNIAEGQGRNTAKEFSRFLAISLGSVYELQTQIIICVELGYLSREETQKADSHIQEVSKMLHALLKKLGS